MRDASALLCRRFMRWMHVDRADGVCRVRLSLVMCVALDTQTAEGLVGRRFRMPAYLPLSIRNQRNWLILGIRRWNASKGLVGPPPQSPAGL